MNKFKDKLTAILRIIYSDRFTVITEENETLMVRSNYETLKDARKSCYDAVECLHQLQHNDKVVA